MFPLQLGFQTSKAAGAELKGQVVTFLRVRERGGRGREGPAPKKGGGSREEGVEQEEWSFSFRLFLCCH